MGLKKVSNLLKDAAGKTLIVAGVALLWVAALFVGLTPSAQWVFAVSLFFGVVFTVSGFATILGLLASPLRSKVGMASCLIIAASVFIAFALMSLVIGAHIVDVLYIPRIGPQTGWRTGSGVFTPGAPPQLVTVVDRPNAWLFMPLGVTGLCLLAAGFLLRLLFTSI